MVNPSRHTLAVTSGQNSNLSHCKSRLRTIDDVRLAGQQGFKQAGVVLGIVLQIGILDDRKSAAGFLQSRADGGTFSAILTMNQGFDLGMAVPFFEDQTSLVCRAVIHDNDLLLTRRGQDTLE